ncbi:MAG: hypothetical protein AAGH60_15570 [Pseudomonadota bacterium]
MNVRERLADLLTVEMGRIVFPEKLRPQKGAWRTNHRLDVCRWEASLPSGYDGGLMPAISWETMTDILRCGAEIEIDGATAEVFCLNTQDDGDLAIRDWQRRAARLYRAGKDLPEPPHETFGQWRHKRDEEARAACNTSKNREGPKR